MSNTSKDMEKWWMIFRSFPPEPRGLWRLYMLSLCFTLVLFLLAAFYAKEKHGWSDEPTFLCTTSNCEKQETQSIEKPSRCEKQETKSYRKINICEKQKTSWEDMREEAINDCQAAENRINSLKEARRDPQNKYFSQPWDWFEQEIAQLKKVIKKTKKYKIYSLSESFLLLMSFIFFPLIFYIFLGRLITLHARSIKNHFGIKKVSQKNINHWIMPHVTFAFFIAIFMIIAEVFTSIIAQEKSWFGWSSFCITPVSFIILNISYIGFGFVAAAPFTMLWCVSRKEYIPPPIPSAQKRKFGVVRYVEFLQTWTLWLILAPATVGIVWLRYVVEIEPRFSPARLLHGVGVGLIITIIVIRLIRNAIILRFKYYNSLSAKKYRKADTIPTDPTKGFLGTEWWKLPATVTATIASIWVLLEWLGIAKLFTDLLR